MTEPSSGRRPPYNAAVIALFAIAAAIAFHSTVQRYQIAQVADGAVVRLDRQTGTVVACMLQRDPADGRHYVVPCTGRRN